MNRRYQSFRRITLKANRIHSQFKLVAMLPALLLVLLTLFCSPEYFSQPNRLVIKTATVVRSGPGTKYKIITTVKQGTQLFLLESENEWHRVELPDGRRGWIYQGVARVVGGENVVAIVDNAKVRRGPGEEYSAIAMIKKGKELRCLGERGKWFFVELIKGRNGWIAKRDAQKVSYRNIITTKPTYAYRQASKKSGILLNITSGAELIQLGKENDFYQVRLPGGQIAYVPTSAVTVIGERTIRLKGRAVLRWGGNEGYGVKDTLEVGTQLTKLSVKKDWIEVKTANGETGWIHKSAVTTTASTEGEEFIDEKPVYLITNQDSNIRERPTTKSPRVDRVKQGVLLLKLDQQDDWIKIKLSDGRIGWIYEPLTDVDITLLLTKIDCNIRLGPSTRYQLRTRARKGMPLVRIEERDGWTRVRLVDSKIGWIKNGLFVPLDSLLFANQRCRVRRGPGTQYEMIKWIDYGEFVYYLGKTKNWYRIRLIPDNESEQGEVGYIRDDLLNLSGNEFITNERANVRKNASTDYAKIASLPPRTRVQKIGQKNDWVHVRLADGRKGWIYKKLVSYTFYPYPRYMGKKQVSSQMAATQPIYENSAESVNIQAEPVTEYSTTTTATSTYTPAPVSEPVNSTGNSYYYMASREPEEALQNTREQIKIGVRLRTKPDTSASIIMQLPVGVMVTRISQSGEWWEVMTMDGIYGWVHQVAFGLAESKYLYAKKNVNVRFGPGTNYKIVDIARMGDVLTRLEKRGKWYNVRLKDGKKGWVREDLVTVQRVSPGKLLEFKAIPAYGRAMTKVNTQLFEGPSRNYPVKRNLPVNTFLKIIGKYGDWRQVALLNDIDEGWVPITDIIKKYHSRIITKNKAEVYVAPNSQSGLVTRVNRAKTFRPLDQRNDWFRIVIGDQTGWINLKDVAPLKYPRVYVNQPKVNVRRLPSIKSPKIAILPEGVPLEPTDDEGDWLFVKLPRGDKGWIHTKLVNLQRHPYVIVTSDAKVYTKPTAGSVWKGMVKREERFIALDKTDHWYKIPYRTDDVGWIYSGFVREDVKGTKLIRERSELRMGPGLDYELIGYVNKGAQTKLLREIERWSQVEVRPGLVGWIQAEETVPLELKKVTAKVMGDALKRPDLNSQVVGRVIKGKSYKPFEKRGEFYKIQLKDGVYGWAHMSNFEAKKKKTVFTLEATELRSGPSSGYAVLEKLAPATDLIVLGTDGQYYHVEVKGTKVRGYVLKAFVFE